MLWRIAAIATLALAPLAAQAADPAAPPGTVTVQPPPGHPSAFTPAPVPSVGPRTVPPADRAGNADDAGPVDSTPLSSDIAPGLGSSPAADSQRRRSDPTDDPAPPPR